MLHPDNAALTSIMLHFLLLPAKNGILENDNFHLSALGPKAIQKGGSFQQSIRN